MFSYQNGHAEAAKGVQRFQALLLGLKRNFIVKKIEFSIRRIPYFVARFLFLLLSFHLRGIFLKRVQYSFLGKTFSLFTHFRFYVKPCAFEEPPDPSCGPV